MRPHPKRTSTNTRSPRSWGTCDRSGFITNQEKLVWQYDWRGTKLVNLRVLVAPDMLDKPQRQLGTIILPPDPVGILNARPEPYSVEEQTYRLQMDGTVRLQMDGILRLESNLQSGTAGPTASITPGLIQSAANTSLGQSSVTVTLGGLPQQGDTVLVGVISTGAATSFTATDGVNNYTLTPLGVTVDANGRQVCVLYLPIVPAGAGAAITVTANISVSVLSAFAVEVAGDTLFDTEAFGSGTGTFINAPTVTTAQVDFLFAVTDSIGSFATANSPWIVLNVTDGDGAAYMFQTVAGSQTADFTLAGTPTWACQIVAFKP